MGLKTAACWFGLNWSVESTELNSGVTYRTEVDVASLQKYKNEEIEVEEVSCKPREHGTVIRIWNLHRGISGRQIGKIKDQLRGIYRSDIRFGEIKIFYNGDGLEYNDPTFLIESFPDGSTKEWKKDINFCFDFKEKEYGVNGFIAIREPASTSDAGFALLKNGRVIVGGYENNYRPEEIFEKSNSYVYQRLYGELNLNNWPVTQTKDGFDWFNGLEDTFIDILKTHCEEFIRKSKEYRKNKIDPLKKGFDDTIESFTKVGIINDANVVSIKDNEIVIPPSFVETEKIKPKNAVSTEIVDVAKRNAEKISFSYKGNPYIFNILTHIGNPTIQWLYISPNTVNQNTFTIDWNLANPFF